MRTSFLVSLLATLAVVVALPFVGRASTAHAYPGADGVYVSEACNNDGTLQVYVGWTAYDTGQQWLDLAKGDGFEAGAYSSYGPASPGTESVSWRGFTQAQDYAVRIVTATPDGWTASAPVEFKTSTCPIVVAQPVPVAVPVLISFQPPGPGCPGCAPMPVADDSAESPSGPPAPSSSAPTSTDAGGGT